MGTTNTVAGQSRGHCEQTVAAALRTVSGVPEVTVEREGKRASVDGDADATALLQTIEAAEYTAHV